MIRLLAAAAFVALGFVIGCCYEATRKGGSQDLADQLRENQPEPALRLIRGAR